MKNFNYNLLRGQPSIHNCVLHRCGRRFPTPISNRRRTQHNCFWLRPLLNHTNDCTSHHRADHAIEFLWMFARQTTMKKLTNPQWYKSRPTHLRIKKCLLSQDPTGLRVKMCVEPCENFTLDKTKWWPLRKFFVVTSCTSVSPREPIPQSWHLGIDPDGESHNGRQS